MDNVVNALVGVAIVIFSLVQASASCRSRSRSCSTPSAIGLGVAVHYAVLFGLATVAFWIVRAQGLIYGYYNVFNIARYPDVVFRGVFQFIFSYLIPVIIVANVPARMLARALESPWRASRNSPARRSSSSLGDPHFLAFRPAALLQSRAREKRAHFAAALRGA